VPEEQRAVSPTPQGELTRRYLINTFSQGALRATSALAALWAARELVRAIGPVQFGLVALSTSLVGYMSFLGLGLPAGLVRQVADLHGRGLGGRLRRLVRSAFLAFCGIGILGAAGLAAFSWFGGLSLLAIDAAARHEAARAILATAAVVLVSWPLSVFSAALTGLQRYPVLNTLSGIAALAAAIVSVTVARAGGGAAGVILSTGGVMALAGLAQAAMLHRLAPRAAAGEPASSSRDEMRSLVSFSAWILALELAALVIYQTDQILLGTLVSVESLTAYYVAAKLHNVIREGNGVLVSTLYPMIASEQGRGNEAAAEQAIYRGTRYECAILGPATLAVILLARPFLRIWMGEGFAYLAPLAQAFVSYMFLALLTSIASQVALARGEAKPIGQIAIGSAVVNLVVSLSLIRTWGIAGVIAGTLAAYALAVPAQIAIVFPKLGIARRRFLSEVVYPVFPVLAAAAPLWWAALRWLDEPRGVVALLAQGALVVATCWAPLWFTAVEPRDRKRILVRLSALLPGSA